MTVLLREAIGDRLRHARTNQRRTLREVSRAARVSLGYLSEVERGRKEASSELLAAICDALDLPLSELLHRVASDITAVEPVTSSAPLSPEQIEQIEQPASAEQLPAGATAGATIEGGRLMPAVLGNELADFRLQPVLSHQLGSSLDRPRGEVVAA